MVPSLFRELPKAEIHIHAEAVVGLESYRILNERNRVDPNLKTTDDIKRLLKVDSLKRMIDAFIFLQSFFRKPDDFQYMVQDVGAYCTRNGIRYMEAHVSPSTVHRLGFVALADMFDRLEDGFRLLQAGGGPDVRIIVDLSRTFGLENARRNLDFLLGYIGSRSRHRIVGVGLGGQEANNSCLVYRDVLRDARQAGLHTVVHAGEEVESESIWNAVDKVGAERIGHGTSAFLDSALREHLRDLRIPLEVCPTSNIITGKYVDSYEGHPVRLFYDEGLLVTLNTDDPVLFDIELSDEYRNLQRFSGFTDGELFALAENGVQATFAPEERKRELLEEIARFMGRCG
jgi:adenosine deaminase